MRKERLEVEDSILLLKQPLLQRQIGHCIRDERLQVEESIFLF